MKPIFFSADNLLTDCIWLDSTSYGYGINTQQKIKILIVSNLSSSIDDIKDNEWYMNDIINLNLHVLYQIWYQNKFSYINLKTLLLDVSFGNKPFNWAYLFHFDVLLFDFLHVNITNFYSIVENYVYLFYLSKHISLTSQTFSFTKKRFSQIK